MPVPPEPVPPEDTLRHDPSDDELVLYYYGETRRRDDVRRRLDASPAARARYEELCRLLAAVESAPVPEPEARYGERVWNRLQADLAEDRSASLWRRLGRGLAEVLAPPRLRTAGALVAIVAIAFLAGRFSQIPQEVNGEAGWSADARRSILQTVVAEHLEQSERLLIELANAPDGDRLDVSFERHSAETLLPANRLYRQSVRRTGEADLAEVLDELERLLLDLAHGPEEISAVDLDDLRSRIDDVLFKVQVLSWRLRQHETPAPERALTNPSRGLPRNAKLRDGIEA